MRLGLGLGLGVGLELRLELELELELGHLVLEEVGTKPGIPVVVVIREAGTSPVVIAAAFDANAPNSRKDSEQAPGPWGWEGGGWGW